MVPSGCCVGEVAALLPLPYLGGSQENRRSPRAPSVAVGEGRALGDACWSL